MQFGVSADQFRIDQKLCSSLFPYLIVLILFATNVHAITFDDDTYTISSVGDTIEEIEFNKAHSEPLLHGTTVSLNSSVILEESVPVKDSLNYGSMLTYRFEPDLQSEWTHSYQILVYISACLCRLPEGWYSEDSYNGLSLHYTFNETTAENLDLAKMSHIKFKNGYAQGLAEIEMSSEISNYTLYMTITPDECNNCTSDSTWVFEFAVSQKNLLFLYDTEPILSVVDVDYDSAIFEAQEIGFSSGRWFGMYIFENKYPIPTALNQSWCAINENAQYAQLIEIDQNSTLGVANSFVVSGLEMSTEYYSVLVMTNNELPYGGGVFQPFSFAMSSTKACKLLYNLDFCDEVAYAVPVSTDLLNGDETWNEFASAYDNNSQSFYQPFEYALQQIPCDTELDARYSPISTCDDCRYSYRQWLCAVTIPRCVSASNAGSQNIMYEAGSGRNNFIADTINPPLPYAEVLPCLNVCQVMVRDCPADFGFACPELADLIKLSYGDPNIDDLDDSSNSANVVSTSTDISGSLQTYRVCNYLGESNRPNSTSTS